MTERRHAKSGKTGTKKQPAAPKKSQAAGRQAAHDATTASILKLQQTIGNKATIRLLSKDASTIKPIQLQMSNPVVRRKEYGLQETARTSDFAKKALEYWRNEANKDKTLIEFATFLMDTINAELKTIPGYPCNPVMTTSGYLGSFGRTGWTMKINTRKFSWNTDTSTVGQLTTNEVAEIVDTFYHEARHAEQYFRMARVLAGQGKKVEAIKKELDIPEDVAKEAAKYPLASSADNDEMIAQAQEWQKIAVGIHADYKVFINNFDDEAKDAQDTAESAKGSNLEEAKGKLDTAITQWSGEAATSPVKFIQSEIDRINHISNKTEMDKTILKYLTDIQKLLLAVIQKWKDNKTRDLASVNNLGKDLRALHDVTFQAYKNHEHEKDAWAVGRAAGTAFKSQAAKSGKATK